MFMILTIDTGGSKTKFILWDDKENIISQKTTIGFGVVDDTDKINSVLLNELLEFSSGYIIDKVVCNLGGKNKTEISNTIKQVFANAKIKVFRESEGLIGIALCEKMDAQVALLAGTGSIAIAPLGENTVICGGWGANISDKGSGYDLGLKAISSSLEQLDGTLPMSELAKDITGLFSPPELLSAEEYCALRDEIRSRMAPLDRAHIANYAKKVSYFAEKGDQHAIELLSEVGCNLADIVLSSADKIGSTIKRVVVTGGMVRSKAFWQETFEKKLKEKHKIEQVFYFADGINDAMYTIAKKLF